MAKAKGKKPKQILELEKYYGLIWKEKETIGDDYMWGDDTQQYALDERGKIISLSINGQEIKDIEPITRIKSLKHLNLWGNQISDISGLEGLGSLESLNLSDNTISDISILAKLHSLHTLSISGNPLIKFPYLELINLKILRLSGTSINNIESLSGLKNLEELNIGKCGIEHLEPVSELKELKILDASQNYISDLSPLKFLKNLREVSLSYNEIKDVSVLFQLPQLEKCSLMKNLVFEIKPMEIKRVRLHDDYEEFEFEYENPEEHKNDLWINVAGNPLSFPPISVVGQGDKAVDAYYSNANLFGAHPLNEGRIILIGEGSSGKSSLVKQVLYNTFNDKELQTNGIKIDQWHLPYEGRDLVFNLWDFGGQEIQHAVHKFFFTSGCLYVLVLDNRKEEEPEYWLQQIESLGGSAPVLVVFNKADENKNETADRKFLKEKYPNIVGFFNTSCKSGQGIKEFRETLQRQAVKISSVNDQFPGNWFNIKKAIEQMTSDSQHYLTYETYKAICDENAVKDEETQKLLLKYLTTIGAVTWFGDTYLTFMQLLNPAWITQGVYRIITGAKTARQFGQIHISDFHELLHPENEKDFTYEEKHYGYILSLMKKFDLCYTEDDEHILIPSAFGKEPRVEYSDYKGERVRTYIFQFKDYLPIALIHKYIARNIEHAYDNNYWYSGIVLRDPTDSSTLTMVHADKEAKRIYVRVKGDNKLPMWERVRGEFNKITLNYARVLYSEQVVIGENPEILVEYEDLLNHLRAGRAKYFHSKQMKDYQVAYLIGWFETKDETLKMFERGIVDDYEPYDEGDKRIFLNIQNILNQQVSVNQQVEINIHIQQQASELKTEANYLLEEVKANKELKAALQKVVEFADEVKRAKTVEEVKEKGWGRKLKNILPTLSNAGEQVKNIKDGAEALASIMNYLQQMGEHFQLKDILSLIS